MLFYGSWLQIEVDNNKIFKNNTSSPADKISGRFWRRIKNPETSDTIKWLK